MVELSMAGATRLPAWIAVLFLFAAGVSTPAHAANQPPSISGVPATWVYVGSPYSFRPTVSDPDGPSLRFAVFNKPSWATFSTSTGRLSGTPTAVGWWTNIRIEVSDGIATRALSSFSIRATRRDNTAPVISGAPKTLVVAGSSYVFQPVARDAEGDPLRFLIVNRPAWAAFNSVTGQLSGTPAAASVGTYSSIVITVSDGAKKVSLPAFSITVSLTVNRAPTISGTPRTSVNVSTAYAFRPTVSDADGDALAFSISNRPAWATFNTATGQLSGTPTAMSVGTYSNIVISVSDGKSRATLAAFAITVTDVSRGAAELMWEPPTQNTDGSALTNLAGYRIVYGASATRLTQTIQVANAGLSSYVVENLAPGTYYFAVRAYASSGAESSDSNVVARVVQ
jgi:hypothetical protein